MQILNPLSIPLNAINLIEASAGTGKSWTVTLLYLRLVLESNLTVDQILVVTFTDAATKELRDAIRNRLLEALTFLENPDDNLFSDKPEYRQLFDVIAPDEGTRVIALSRLQRAKFSIDEAAIFTIHSFCQRALTENAFEASLPFESELMDDDKPLMQKLTDDYWRRTFYKAPKTLLYKLQKQSITPDSLLDDIWKHVGKPYLIIEGPSSTDITAEKQAEIERLFSKVKSLWTTDNSEIKPLVLGNTNLNGNKYRKATVEKNCSQFDSIASLTDIDKKLLETDLKRFKTSSLKEGTKAKCVCPEHPFFDFWESFSDLWEEIEASADAFLSQIRIDLLKHLQEELPREKKRLGVLSFDDLLLQLQSALVQKPELATQLKNKYKAALIDEFQDTDPVQYDIFSRIYTDLDEDDLDKNNLDKNNAVFLVGDPKQAIYSFRGGDIHTYLKAKQNTLVENHYTLNTNYRSHHALISAYNSLYKQSDNPFQDKGIEYVHVNAGKEFSDFETQDKRKPLQFWQVFQEKGESADPLKKRIANAVAGDIATLLNNKTQIEGRQLCGGDFAILIRSHTQGDIIKSALSARGIASIQSSKKTIFETHEANEIIYLLSAIIEPQQEDNVRRALVTELMGKTAEDLLTFETDANLWETQLVNFQYWQSQWRKQGFLPMMRHLMLSENVYQHLLSFVDGERRLTNVLHLSELIHRVARQQSFSMEEVLRWLKNQQESASTLTDSKEGELRLESDDNLVKIVTIHKSKGLEYPIVYCPFVGLTGQGFKDKTFTFHNDGKTYLEVGSAQIGEHKRLRLEEEKAEQTRLLYVALTRAKYQCHVVCFPQKGDTALSWLMTNGISIKNKKDFIESYQQNLSRLVQESEHIGVDDLPEIDASIHYQSDEKEQKLSARSFKAKIKSQAQVTSFSGLSANSHAQTVQNQALNEGQDHDELSKAVEELEQSQMIEFPRGATAGSALHEIFEHLDFTQPLSEQQSIIETSLSKWGFDEKHQEAANSLLTNSLEADIFDGFSLNQLTKKQRLDEMEFYLPLDRLDVAKLKQVLLEYLPKESGWDSVISATKTLNFKQIEGFLKGYIDLIFKHESQFYIVDYKSNALEDYSPESLMPVMASSHYYLQYLLYSVALHRYLKKRVANYSWEKDVGGAYYLFIRGLNKKLHSRASRDNVGAKRRQPEGKAQPHKNGNKWGGVFFNKPSIELINALDGLFTESLLMESQA